MSAAISNIVGDLVEFVVSGLVFLTVALGEDTPFAEVLGKSVAIAMVEFDGKTIKVGEDNLIVGDTYTEAMLIESCASHGSVARKVAPALLVAIQSDSARAVMQATAKRAQTIAVKAANALHAYDSELVKPYDLRAILAVWAIDSSSMVVNTHTTVLDSPVVQGKTPADGSGNRLLYWSEGTYVIDNKSIYSGCTLTIGDGMFMVTRKG